MRLWVHAAIRQWQKHGFLTTLLIAGYAFGISLTTLVFATISGAADFEREIALGDPSRVISASISGSRPIALDVEAWLEGVPISWGWVYLGGTGARLDPSLANANVLAFFGSGEPTWRPPLRSGRFFTGEDLRQGKQMMVRGEEISGTMPGFEVVGVAYDPPFLERGWSRDLFLPFSALPPGVIAESETLVLLKLEVREGQDVAKAKAGLLENLTRQHPGDHVQVETMADVYARSSERFRQAYSSGFMVSGLVLGFVVANVSILSIHWVTQRRREIGVRMALGASNLNLLSMVLTEQLLLAGIGGVVALPLILGASRVAAILDLPMDLSLNALGVTLGATILGGILSAIPPVYLFLRAPLRENLYYRD